MKEFLNRNFLGIIVIILAVILYFQRCNNDAVGIQKPDTVYSVQQIPQPPVYIPQYVPIPQSTQTPIIIPPNYQPAKELQALIKQYEDLVKKHIAVKTYQDSIELRDTAGLKVGIVNLTDIVSENEIKSRKPNYQLNFPKTTITITQPYKPRNQLYVGGGILGTENNLISGGKIGAYLKNRKDQLYGISVHKTNNYPLIYSLEGYWKIRLKK